MDHQPHRRPSCTDQGRLSWCLALKHWSGYVSQVCDLDGDLLIWVCWSRVALVVIYWSEYIGHMCGPDNDLRIWVRLSRVWPWWWSTDLGTLVICVALVKYSDLGTLVTCVTLVVTCWSGYVGHMCGPDTVLWSRYVCGPNRHLLMRVWCPCIYGSGRLFKLRQRRVRSILSVIHYSPQPSISVDECCR